MNTLKRIGVALVVLLVGILIGAWGIQTIESSQRNFIAAASEERVLRENVLLLKMLDEGKADFAKSLLEANIQSSLQSAPITLALATDTRMRKLLEQTLAMARLTMADRTKSYSQLTKEIAK